MNIWIASLGVALGSYLFRIGPLLTRRTATMPARAERVVQHAGTAALVALLIGSIARGDGAAPTPVVIIATIAGLLVGLKGGSMLRVLGVGVGVVLAARLVVVAAASIDLTNAGWTP